jgi:chromosome segregation ATPase
VADKLVHNKDVEMSKLKEKCDRLQLEITEKEAQIEKLTMEKEDLERNLDIKMNEVDYYKGELEMVGLESVYSESVAGSDGGKN